MSLNPGSSTISTLTKHPTPDAFPIEDRTNWRAWVIPEQLRYESIHRWFVFPHSFSHQLINALISEWDIKPPDILIDPFVGAGTSLVAAKSLGVSAIGYDISPLSVFVTNVKLSSYNKEIASKLWKKLSKNLKSRPSPHFEHFPELITKAFPGRALDILAHIRREIDLIEDSSIRNLFLLGLLSILKDFSKAIPNGGWLRWSKHRIHWAQIIPAFRNQIEKMIDDIGEAKGNGPIGKWGAEISDARELPFHGGAYDCLITSPPYPNRHDYTRIFNVELLFAFLNQEQIRKLRHQSFQSHVESRPTRNGTNNYSEPDILSQTLNELTSKPHDRRVPPMLKGYFEDLYLTLNSAAGVMRRGARMAYIVGNARYSGVNIDVDRILAAIGEQIGLNLEKIIVLRYRGNSAQQMGKYGREKSRESIVIFRTD